MKKSWNSSGVSTVQMRMIRNRAFLVPIGVPG